MKNLHSLIIFLLCLMVVGFFANFAQNDYGTQIIILNSILLSVLFGFKTFFEITKPRGIQFFLALSLLCGLSLVFQIGSETQAGISLAYMNVYFFFGTVFCFISGPTIIIPISLLITERKQSNKTLSPEYFNNLFLCFFCLGIYLKNKSLAGAGVIITLSGLIILPTLYLFLRHVFLALKQKSIVHSLTGFSYLFFGFTMLAFVFKNQHWPGSNFLLFASVFIYTVIIVVGLFIHFYQKKFRAFWANNSFTFKTLLVSFSITTLYVILMRNDMVPEVYSNYKPKALQELISKSNDITSEGKINAQKAGCYNEQYEEFLLEQLH